MMVEPPGMELVPLEKEVGQLALSFCYVRIQ